MAQTAKEMLDKIKEVSEVGVMTNSGLYFKVCKSDVRRYIKDNENVPFYISIEIYKVERKVMIIK